MHTPYALANLQTILRRYVRAIWTPVCAPAGPLIPIIYETLSYTSDHGWLFFSFPFGFKGRKHILFLCLMRVMAITHSARNGYHQERGMAITRSTEWLSPPIYITQKWVTISEMSDKLFTPYAHHYAYHLHTIMHTICTPYAHQYADQYADQTRTNMQTRRAPVADHLQSIITHHTMLSPIQSETVVHSFLSFIS